MILNPATELSFSTFAAFPATGQDNLLYIATDTNVVYRWNGTAYVSVSSAAVAAGNKGDIQYRGNSPGSFAAAPNSQLNYDDVKVSLQIGSAPSATVADALITAAKNVNSFVQMIIQNTQNGTNSSSDFVAMNDLGTDSTYYVDLGINSSTYSDPSLPLSLPNDSYLYSENGNFTFGTDSSGKYILFHTGGFALDKERMRIIDAALAKDALIKLSSHLQLLSDTTANRPTTPVNGMLRYNITTAKFEGYENGVWKDIIGEINTASNVGTNAKVFKQKTGVNFEFRTLVAGTGIALNETATDIQIINTATGTSAIIAYYFLNSQSSFATSSATDVLISGMTNTPAAGTYRIAFDANLSIAQNGKSATVSIYRGGSQIVDSVRTVLAHGNNDTTQIFSQSVVTFNGSQVFEMRVKTDSSSITLTNRAVFMEKLS